MQIFLKIILCFLLFLFIILIFALVCPVTYKFCFRKQDEELLLSVRAKYLFGLIYFMFRYPSKEQVLFRVFGFPIRKKKEKTNTRVNNEEISKEISKEISEEVAEETEDSSETPRKLIKDADISQTQASKDSQNGENKQDKESVFTRCKNLRKEFDFYRRLLEAEFTNTFLKDALKRILQIISSILPKKLNGYIRFGGNTPDITGLAMAGYGMLFCNRRCFKNFTFKADFENPVFEGKIWMKGSVLPIVLIWNSIRILFDKRLRKIRNVIKTHKNRKLKKERKDG